MHLLNLHSLICEQGIFFHLFGEPFGKDNARPVFADRGVRIKRMWVIGKNNDTLRFDFITKNGKYI